MSTTDTTSMKIGTLNPFRYRGYCYDETTGFYYLGSRYYDPVVGRFVNADDVDVLGVEKDLHDKNLYAYCDDNPVNRSDKEGDVWQLALAAGLRPQSKI